MIVDALRSLQAADSATARTLLSEGEAAGRDEALLGLHLSAILAFAAGERDLGRTLLEKAVSAEREAGLPAIAGHAEHALALLLNDEASLAKIESTDRFEFATPPAPRPLICRPVLLEKATSLSVVGPDDI